MSAGRGGALFALLLAAPTLLAAPLRQAITDTDQRDRRRKSRSLHRELNRLRRLPQGQHCATAAHSAG